MSAPTAAAAGGRPGPCVEPAVRLWARRAHRCYRGVFQGSLPKRLLVCPPELIKSGTVIASDEVSEYCIDISFIYSTIIIILGILRPFTVC